MYKIPKEKHTKINRVFVCIVYFFFQECKQILYVLDVNHTIHFEWPNHFYTQNERLSKSLQMCCQQDNFKVIIQVIEGMIKIFKNRHTVWYLWCPMIL